MSDREALDLLRAIVTEQRRTVDALRVIATAVECMAQMTADGCDDVETRCADCRPFVAMRKASQ